MSADALTVDLPGFYGKLPVRGDFVWRNLPRSFLDPWDAWLQGAIAQSREQLSEQWLSAYLTSPLWRFALSPGVCGDAAYAGVMMPSVDRVGRYFPLAITVPLRRGQSLLALVLGEVHDVWFQRAETLILSGLEDDLDLEAFAQRTQALGPLAENTPAVAAATRPASLCWHLPLIPPGAAVGAVSTASTDTSAAAEHERVPAADANPEGHLDFDLGCGCLAGLADQLLAQSLRRYSLWWTQGSAQVRPCLNVCAEMPPAAAFAALLVGQWAQRGWHELLPPPAPGQPSSSA